MYSLYLFRGYLPIIVALAAFLSFGTATFATASISHDAAGHCGPASGPTAHAVSHSSHGERHHDALIQPNAQVKPQPAGINQAAGASHCPVGSGESDAEQGHQCGHHAPSAGPSGVPSLYCNCHSKHADGRAAQAAQEYTGLASQTSSFDAMTQVGIVLSSVNPLPQRLFLDPIEKPPTIS